MNKIKVLGCILAGGMLVAACGDDGGGADSNEYSDAVAEAIRSDGEVPFSDEEIDCLARELVDAVGGPSTFEDADLAPEDIASSEDISEAGLDVSDDQADEIAASFGECDISLTEAFMAGLSDEVPDQVRGCIEENLDDETFAEVFAESLVEGESGNELPPELAEDLSECVGAGAG